MLEQITDRDALVSRINELLDNHVALVRIRIDEVRMLLRSAEEMLYVPKDAADALRVVQELVNFAYEQGFHELGYNPVNALVAAVQAEAYQRGQDATDNGKIVKELRELRGEISKLRNQTVPATSATNGAAKLQRIKELREQFGCSLLAAKRVVEDFPNDPAQQNKEFERLGY